MNIQCSFLILFLPVLCLTFEATNFTSPFDLEKHLNKNVSTNRTIVLSSRIIIYMPESPLQAQPNDFLNFGNFLQSFFGPSYITPLRNRTSLESDQIKKKRDLYALWNTAKNISRDAYNTSANAYKQIAQTISKVSHRSAAQYKCTDLMCKEALHLHDNVTEHAENKTEAKSIRSINSLLKKPITPKQVEIRPTKVPVNQNTVTEVIGNASASTVLTKNETTNNLLPVVQQSNITQCNEHSGCLQNTSNTKTEPTESVSNSPDVNFAKYRDWLWQHIDSDTNEAPNSSDPFLKRHYFLSNSGDTAESVTAKNSELLHHTNFNRGNKLRPKRDKEPVSEKTHELEFEDFFAQQFRQKDIEKVKFVTKEGRRERERRGGQYAFNIEKEYNDAGNQPTRPLLLFVTIPSFIGIGVFVLALCFLTQSGAWCCRLFDPPPHRSSTRGQLPKTTTNLNQTTSTTA